MEEGKQFGLSFSSVCGKKVEADFDGGVVTSDSGVLLAREVDRKIGVIDCLVSALWDRRHPSYVSHSLEDLLRQRVFQLVCGYEDGNDSDALRSDPALKIGCDRLPLTGARPRKPANDVATGEQSEPTGSVSYGSCLRGAIRCVV